MDIVGVPVKDNGQPRAETAIFPKRNVLPDTIGLASTLEIIVTLAVIVIDSQ